MKRIYSLDFFKLLFAYIIALGHFGTSLSPGAFATVQIFFIISGYFLAMKFYGKSYRNTDNKYNQWNYTIEHVKSLYPHYIFSLIILALYFLIEKTITLISQPSINQLSIIVKDLYSLIPEIFLLQNTGFFGGGINYPLWQLCALVICGYFIYGLLCFNEKLSRELIFPAAILMIQVILNSDVNIWGSVGFFHIPLLRAFSPLCIGVLTYYFTTTEYYTAIKGKKLILNIASIISLLSIFIFEGYRNIYLITFVIVLLAVFDNDSWINKLLNRKIFKHCGNLSYAIYLNHALLRYFFQDHFFPIVLKWLDISLSTLCKNIIFLITLTLYSIITMYIVNKIKIKIKSK